jgi:hypothetical protein
VAHFQEARPQQAAVSDVTCYVAAHTDDALAALMTKLGARNPRGLAIWAYETGRAR